MKKRKLAGSEAIATLVWSLLQPAMAGGMTEKRAQALYEEVMSSIASLGTLTTGLTGFETLRNELLDKWAVEYGKAKRGRAK